MKCTMGHSQSDVLPKKLLMAGGIFVSFFMNIISPSAFEKHFVLSQASLRLLCDTFIFLFALIIASHLMSQLIHHLL